MTSPFRDPPVLEGLLLAPLVMVDAPFLLAHFSDPEVVRHLDIEPLASLAEAQEIIAWAEERRAKAEGLRWSIREERGGEFIGTCGFNALCWEEGGKGEIAYDLSRRWWGKGLMAEILPALARFGFGPLGLHRLEAKVDPENRRSCAVLERSGFRREGVLSAQGYWKGAWRAQVLYRLERDVAAGPD
ncbi:MAG: GNAT family N-acetyltransferase [Caulobacteraceae bacterium]